ncbi:magnesium transporter [Microcella alkaliphila]|uniref:Magnesium transporter n=1 Tax=Microcella alkaliphila TaxID=279828 RepID=A0A0U4X0J0_9MICO|nr:magnesium transporter [Microcella alkaliphila]
MRVESENRAPSDGQLVHNALVDEPPDDAPHALVAARADKLDDLADAHPVAPANQSCENFPVSRWRDDFER